MQPVNMCSRDHGRRSVGDGGGTRPLHFSAWGDSIGIVPPPLFSSEKLRGI